MGSRARAGENRQPPAIRRGTPPEDVMGSRQVSWLAGLSVRLAFPNPKVQWLGIDFGSPLTVAGAAPALSIRAHRLPSWPLILRFSGP